MKKTMICAIPMKITEKTVYNSSDPSLPAGDTPVSYPVLSFLEKTLKPADELNILLLVKKDPYGNDEKNVQLFKDEFSALNASVGAKATFTVLDTAFSQDKGVYHELMQKIIDYLPDGDRVLADITYGPKDLPIVLFSALHFAEKFLRCKIDNILYGQASFLNGHVVNTQLTDMSPLFYLDSVTALVREDTPERARLMLKTLLSL